MSQPPTKDTRSPAGLPSKVNPAIGPIAERIVVIVGGLLVATSAAIHLHLWAGGYRHIPVVGNLFLAQGITGIAIAITLVLRSRPSTIAIAAGYLGATVAGLLLSASRGIFGFRETLSAPYAVTSLTIEAVGVLIFVILLAQIWSSRHREIRAPSPRPTRRPRSPKNTR